ncbi:retrovirus-related pol polyprotein from transposon TNT 1-94 [Tanacetum coccineum]|uniref:Retrovirus-related pol polyprotein from transposon TNT 1-94 n=1 Tax=Tanacetum coccineum TaxID=301880 RepID=A0ABQ5BMF5_9ASTR
MTNETNVNAPVNVTGASVTNTVANHAEKPEKFNGQNFKKWQQKMFFYLITLNLARFLKETAPQTMTVKELWESLERKYKTKNAGTKKLVVAHFLDYKMDDSKIVITQVQDLQILLHDIHAEGMTLSETFQVTTIIEKLPPSWVEFKNYLKHKRKEMSVEDLVVRLRIEEDNKLAQKNTYTPDSAKANMVEHAGSSSKSNSKAKGKGKKKNDKKSKGKAEYLAPKAGIVKQKFQGTCYNCDQPGHRAANCKMPKRVNPRQANMVNDNVDMIAMVSDVIAMISEVNLVGSNNSGWWVDTGATRHVCADKSMFHSFRAVDNGEKLYMGNSATADIKGEGDVILKMTSEKELKLTNVLYVSEIRKNLVSGWLLNKFGFRLVFESDKFVLSKNQMYVGKGYAVNGMFKLNVMVVKNDINKMNSSAYLIESSNVWHGRLGHVNFNSMRRLIKFNSIPNFHIDSKYKCETCVEAKLTRSSFKSVKRKTEPLDMIHTDICDLKSLPTKGGNKYFITFIDDCTKYCYVYLLKSKDEAIDKFVLYKTEVENQLGQKIKVVRSDRGGEYVSPFAELCAKHGIRHEFTAPYSPQQNGIAERKNRTLKEMVNAMLISSGLSQDMWGEAILTATYLLNKIPRKEKEETPYELWMGRKPSYKYLRVWGCLAKNSSAYHFIVHDSKNPDIQKNVVMESRNASFFENIFPCLTKETGSSSRLDDEVVQDKRQRDDNDLHDERQDQLEEEEVEPRRSKRARTEKSFGPDFVSFMVENEPTSYREALMDLPPGCKPLGYKWIFKKKMKADGTIDKYKARLVIKGYRQREGLYYLDTYSPVTRITSIRMVLVIATLRNLEVHQMDVKTAFLNEDLEEEIYMNQPEGFIALRQESKVCRLVKSLYGLKQALKQWHQKFDHTMLESGFKINECDKCVYVKDTSSGYVILCLYVDDMLIIGSKDKMIKSTKDMLKSKFDMKDMSLADVILGIKIIRTHNGPVLNQAHYVDKNLNTHNVGDSGLAITPIDTSTRPDLAYAVSMLSRYTSNPSVVHWKAMTRVLHYLRHSRDYGLHYDRYPAVIEGYIDANWISDIKDSRLTSGYMMTNETNVTSPVNVTGAPVTNTVANHAEKPEKFNGQNFKRWQQKDVLLSHYFEPCATTTAKELWESLERKYKTEDAGTKKFVVARFLDYKMGDSKTMITQVQDLQDLLHDIHAGGMTLSETFQVVAIIEKLPPSWVEFKNYLKHKRKEMSVEDLVVRLRIEEDNKLA